MNYFPATIGSEKVTIDGVKVRNKLELVSSFGNRDFANPSPSNSQEFVVFRGDVLAFVAGTSSSNNAIYRWDSVSDTWTEVIRMLDTNNRYMVVYDDDLYLLSKNNSNYHDFYKFDGETLTALPNFPVKMETSNGLSCVVAYRDKIHVFGGDMSSGSSYHVYNWHYVWDGNTWTQLNNMSSSLRNASAVVYNDKIYTFGDAGAPTKRMVYDGESWVTIYDIPYDVLYCSALVFENKIHILGSTYDGSDTAVPYKHYNYDGQKWESDSLLPDKFGGIKYAITYKDKIHVFRSIFSNSRGVNVNYKHYTVGEPCFFGGNHNLVRVVLNRDLWLTNLPFDYSNLLIAVYSDGYKKVVDATTCSVSEGTVFTDEGGINVTASYSDGETTKSVSGTINVSESISWSLGSDEDINKVVKWMDDGVFTPQQVGWQVGDTRTVHLSAMDATNVGESHVEQDVDLVIMNIGGKTLTNGKTCNFVVGQKKPLTEQGYMYKYNPNTAAWSGSNRRTWCNNEYKNAFPNSIQGIFKQFKNTGYLGSNTDDYFALPSEKEVWNSGEKSTDVQFEFYKNAENRKQRINWWTRTPVDNGGQSDRYGLVKSAYGSAPGTIGFTLSTSSNGIIPFGCI